MSVFSLHLKFSFALEKKYIVSHSLDVKGNQTCYNNAGCHISGAFLKLVLNSKREHGENLIVTWAAIRYWTEYIQIQLKEQVVTKVTLSQIELK